MDSSLRRLKNWFAAMLFLSPNLLIFLIFTSLPVIASMVLSFYDWDTFQPAKFVGLANYTEMLGFYEEGGKSIPRDPDFWYAMFNTVFLMLTLPLDIFLSLMIAIMLNRKLRGERVLPGQGWKIFLAGVGLSVGLIAAMLLIPSQWEKADETIQRAKKAATMDMVAADKLDMLDKNTSLGARTAAALAAAQSSVEMKQAAQTANLAKSAFNRFRWSALAAGLGGGIILALMLILVWQTPPDWATKLPDAAWWVFRGVAGVVVGLLVVYLTGSIRGQWGVGLVLGIFTGGLTSWALGRALVVARVLLFLPSITAGVAVMLTWLWLLEPDNGAINQLINAVVASLGVPEAWGLGGPNWLSGSVKLHFLADWFGLPVEFYWAKPALMLMGTWSAVGGTSMILYLAALQGVDPGLYEAAEIDGAGAVAKFRFITWPSLAPTTFFILITAIIGSFQSGTDNALVMTGGGPDQSTTTIGFYIYSLAFQYFRMGYAAAVAWILFAVVLAMTLATWRWGKGSAQS